MTLIDLTVSLLGVLLALPATLDDRGHGRRRRARKRPARSRRRGPATRGPAVSASRFGRYAGLIGVVVLAGLVDTRRASRAPPIPRASRRLSGSRPSPCRWRRGPWWGTRTSPRTPNEGGEGLVPACAERGPQILNICQLYERGPVVLAMFVDAGSCTGVLATCRRCSARSPGCASPPWPCNGDRGQLRALMRSARARASRSASTADGAVAGLYKVLSCPQVNFAYRGGVVQSRAILGNVRWRACVLA